MAFDYARSRQTADRLIANFGQPGALRRQSSSGTAHDPVITTTDHAVTIAVMEYDNREIDGVRILQGDRKVYLAKGSLSIEPATSDRLVIGGVAHKVQAVKPLAPGGVVVMYEIQARL